METGAARAWADAFAFSSLWLALGAGVLVVAASRAMGAPLSAPAVGLAVSGTLLVYNVDRLRDLERDRATSPLRSAFVARRRNALVALCVAAGGASAVLGAAAGARAIAVLAPVLAAGLAHRRLKRFAVVKAAYISLAWIAVVVGLPAALAAHPAHIGWVTAVLGAAIGANAIASNVRDAEAAAARYGEALALRVAHSLAWLGVAACALAPRAIAPLAPVPLLTAIALLGFRRTERYGHWVVDGALGVGAAAACALFAIAG